MKQSWIKQLSFVVCSYFAFSMNGSAETLNLESAYRLVSSNNPQVLSAESFYEIQKEEYPQAKSLLLPSLTFTTTSNLTNFRRETPALSRVRYGYKNEINLRQSLLNVSAWYLALAAKSSVKQATYVKKIQEQTVYLEMANAYFSLCTASSVLDLKKQENAAISSKYKVFQSLMKNRLLTRMDVYDSETALNTSNQDVEEQYTTTVLAHNRLKTLLGTNDFNIQCPQEGTVPPQTSYRDRSEWIATVESNNLQLASQLHSLDAANLNLQSAKYYFLPVINFMYAYSWGDHDAFGYSNPTENELSRYSGDIYQSYAELTLTVPFDLSGLNASKIRQASSAKAKAAEDFEDIRRLMIRDVENTLTVLASTAKSLDLARKNAKVFEASLAANEVGLKVGSRRVIDFLKVQQEYYDSRAIITELVNQYFLALLQLEFLSGTINSHSLQKIDRALDG